MRRSGRINRGAWDWCKAKLLEVPGIAIAGIFIGVSGLMSVTFGFRLGEPSGNALIFAAVALAIEGFADLAVPLFWHRLGLIGRVVLIAFLGLCLGYKLEAAKRFAAENLGMRDAATATAAQVYAVAEDDVKRLRKVIADNADARAADLLQTEIDGLLRDPKAEGCTGTINGNVTKSVCPKVDALRAELARAKARDRAQTDLQPAIAKWRGATPATGAAQESVGPVAALLALAGVQVGAWSQFIASLIMAIVEGGAILVPMLIGAASREARKPAQVVDTSRAPAIVIPPAPPATNGADEAPQASPAGIPTLADPNKEAVAAFVADSIEHAPGEKVQASKLFAVYFQWKIERSETPMKVQQFGTVATKGVGLRKRKIGGKNWYLDVRLRHPAQGRKAGKHLQAVAA